MSDERPRTRKPTERNDGHIYLSGRTCDIEFEDGSRGVYFIRFCGDGWLRMREVKTGDEFVCPSSTVWCIRDLDKPN